MRNELQRHKRSDKVKWVLTGIMFFLAFIMIAGLILQVFGTGKTKPSEWFKKQDSEQTEQLPAEGGENGTARTRVKAMATTFEEADTNDNEIMPYSSIDDRFTQIADELKSKDKSFRDATANYSSRIRVKNNINDSIAVNCYRVFYCISSGLGMSCIYLFSDYNPFEGLDRYNVESVEVVRVNGSALVSYGSFLGANVYSLDMSWSPSLNFVDVEIRYNLVEVENPVPLPDDPVKEGYTFSGWYFGTNAEHGESCIRYDGRPIYSDTALHAHFVINTYVVSFDSAGGNEIEAQTVNWNTAATPSAPIREGYNFKGWYLADGTKYENQPIKENTMLTAQWEIKKYTVTFYVEGVEYDKMTVEYGAQLVHVANEVNLKILSISMANGVPSYDDKGELLVTEDCTVDAQEMSNTDKAINTMKENKWAIIGGVAGGVALIAIIAAVCGGKRKRKR